MVEKKNDVTFTSLRKNLKKDFSNFKVYRIALLGDSATQFLNQAIRGYGYEIGLNFEIYESDYNQIEQEVMKPDSGLYRFNPDFIIVFHSTQKLISKFYGLSDKVKSDFATDHIVYLKSLIESVGSKLNSKIIYSNFIEINDYVFGNYGNKVQSSFIYQIRKINYELMNLAIEHKNLFINDISSLNNQEGLRFSFDPKLYITADIVVSLDFMVSIARNVAGIISSITGKFKKCIILDLDNTTWGGIIGDDGMEKIQIGDLGLGKAFSQFQGWIKQLKNRGIILAVCSKNTESIAKEPFEKHPDMELKLDDISVFVANWESKVDNIRHIGNVLNIGYDSMVFIDDNPFERDLIKSQIPDIQVPDLPEDPVEYLDYLKALNLFETASFSEEDSERTRLYQQEAERVILKKAFQSEEDYLKSLGMTSEVKPFDKYNAPRVAQLTQRSNQFNLRTIRYTEDDIYRITSTQGFYTFSFDLKDKFGEHGLIAALILEDKGDSLFIDSWVMSCRVLKRGMEEFIINTLADFARKHKKNLIVGQYIPTSKNGIVSDLYKSLNFVPGNGDWALDIGNFEKNKTYINASQ